MIEINFKFKPWGQIKSNNLKTPMRVARLYKADRLVSEVDTDYRIDHGAITKDPFKAGEYRFIPDNWAHRRHIMLTDEMMIATYGAENVKAYE